MSSREQMMLELGVPGPARSESAARQEDALFHDQGGRREGAASVGGDFGVFPGGQEERRRALGLGGLGSGLGFSAAGRGGRRGGRRGRTVKSE